MKEHRLKINAETQNNKHLIQILLQQICNHILDEKHTNGVRCFGWKGICAGVSLFVFICIVMEDQIIKR